MTTWALTPFGDHERRTPIAEPVFLGFIAVAADREIDLLIEQPGFVERHDPVAVGVIADLVDGLELDQGHAAAGPGFDDLDPERSRARRGRALSNARARGSSGRARKTIAAATRARTSMRIPLHDAIFSPFMNAQRSIRFDLDLGPLEAAPGRSR